MLASITVNSYSTVKKNEANNYSNVTETYNLEETVINHRTQKQIDSVYSKSFKSRHEVLVEV